MRKKGSNTDSRVQLYHMITHECDEQGPIYFIHILYPLLLHILLLHHENCSVNRISRLLLQTNV